MSRADDRKIEWVVSHIEDYYKRHGKVPTNTELAHRYDGIHGSGKKVSRTSSWWATYRPAKYLNPRNPRGVKCPCCGCGCFGGE